MKRTVGYAELSYLRGYRCGASNQTAFANGYSDGRADYTKAKRRAQDRAQAPSTRTSDGAA